MTDLDVLIVGGGCHGVGLLHDLASRRVTRVHLVEDSVLASGSSSRSTKLVHGGLRYLEHITQWPLVYEALSERSLLLRILKGLVQPLPFVLPVFKNDRPSWMLRAGLFLYDTMAGDGGLPRSRKLTAAEFMQAAPYLKQQRVAEDMQGAFLYYDAQMLDDVIVRIAAEAAVKLGASYQEHTRVIAVQPLTNEHGYKVTLEGATGRRDVTARVVINASGAWNNANLITWGIAPKVRCLLNQGSHIIFKKEAVTQTTPAQAAACLLQNKDGRVVFFIPWNGEWLLGTTESVVPAVSPRTLHPTDDEIHYLFESVKLNLDINTSADHISEQFSGVRTMPICDKSGTTPFAAGLRSEWQDNPFASPAYLQSSEGLNLSALSRETIIDETAQNLFSIYGGKYTTYRAECEKLAAKICRRLNTGGQSTTCTADSWFIHELLEEKPEIFKTSAKTRSA